LRSQTNKTDHTPSVCAARRPRQTHIDGPAIREPGEKRAIREEPAPAPPSRSVWAIPRRRRTRDGGEVGVAASKTGSPIGRPHTAHPRRARAGRSVRPHNIHALADAAQRRADGSSRHAPPPARRRSRPRRWLAAAGPPLGQNSVISGTGARVGLPSGNSASSGPDPPRYDTRSRPSSRSHTESAAKLPVSARQRRALRLARIRVGWRRRHTLRQRHTALSRLSSPTLQAR